MSKINKLFSKDLPFTIIKRIHFETGRYINKKLSNDSMLKTEVWNSKFKDSNSFIFQIEDNLKINLYKDSVLSRQIYEGFEKVEIEFVTKFLRNGDIFIDIGANVGIYSLYASDIVGPNGLVFSFEPSPQTFNRFLENITINNFNNIIASNIGLSNEEGILNLQQSDNGHDAYNTFTNEESHRFHNKLPVKVSTLDLQMQNIDKSNISLIKIDVEGWEKFVLNGAQDLLKNYSPIAIIEFTETNTFAAGYLVQEIFDYMVKLGFKWFSYNDGELKDEKKKLHYPYMNLIACKDERVLLNRLGLNDIKNY